MIAAPVDALQRALHPLQAPPQTAGWNHDAIADLLPARLTEAAVLVGLLPTGEDFDVLLTRRNEGLRHHPGQVSFPGGRIEASDAGAAAAALREAHEEVGLPPSLALPLGWLDPIVVITGFRVLPLVVHIDPAFRPVPDPGEVAEVFRVPLAVFMDAGNQRMTQIEHRGRARDVLQFDYPGQNIWGATAMILSNFRERVERCHGWLDDVGTGGGVGRRPVA